MEKKKSLIEKLMKFPRSCYYKKIQKRLINKSPTIIASDCLGGIIYHNLGLKFTSPTINLYINTKDFIAFVNNLKGFIDSEVIEVKDANERFPVGEIEYNGHKITLNFMHYNSFEEAKEKWDERKKRIDYNNIYVTQIVVDATKEDIEAFDALPYKNKMMIVSQNHTNSENVKTHEMFLREDYKPGKILHYKGKFSVKRYIDDIDYVEFLNRANK